MPGGIVIIDQQQTFAGPPIVMSTGPKNEFGTENQAVTRDGEKRWIVQCAVSYQAEPGQKAAAEVIEVTINGADPADSISPGDRIEFNRLAQGISAPERRGERVIGGKPWYSAQGVRVASGQPAAA